MKYKFLSQEELQLLEQELLQFLIINGIDGSEWERINQNEPEKAVDLVGIFSDLVWQRSLEKVKHGEQIVENQYLVFEFREKEIELIGLRCKSAERPQSFSAFFAMLESNPSNMDILQATKSYSGNREEEIFSMINNGLLLSNQTNFDFLKNLYHNA